MNLVKLIVAREKGEECKDFKVNTSNTPVIHLLIVIAISQ
jgi:hypothetical protein